MASNIIPTNQIAKIQTNKKLIAFYDKLHIAPIEHYAQIHAKGETDQTNGKVSSLLVFPFRIIPMAQDRIT